MNTNKAKRYNNGKPRYELLPPLPIEDVVRVYTLGAHKYTVYRLEDGTVVKGSEMSVEDIIKKGGAIIDDGANNWKKGQPWTECMASVERHISEWKKGNDYDPDLGTYHLANAVWGLLSILQFYRTHPEDDNRDHSYLNEKRIGLDIDDVIADWVGHWRGRYGGEVPTSWNFDRFITEKFNEIKDDKDFWMSIPPRVDPKDIPFEPYCYITARCVPTEWTEEWLGNNGFPQTKVHTVDMNTSKIKVATDAEIDIFVDDRFENFVELNKAGIVTYLMDQPHNQRYNVGARRIYSLKELPF